MNKLPNEKRAQVLQMMAEGLALRAITRLTGISRTTLLKLLEDAGQAFSEYQDRTLVNLPCKRVQVDEAWAFCYAKQKNVATAKAAPEGAGDIWTWVGLDADTKLVASFYVGGRDSEAAANFIDDLAPRLANRASNSPATATSLFAGHRRRVRRRYRLRHAGQDLWRSARKRQGPLQPRRMHGRDQDAVSKASPTPSTFQRRLWSAKISISAWAIGA